MSNPAVDFSKALADAVEAASPSVVRVEAGRRHSSSGLVFSDDGYVLTVAHAIDADEGIEVTLESGETEAAVLVGADATTDTALLRLEKSKPAALRAADPNALRRGQLVLSLSRPGRSARVSLGIVSVLGPEWRTFSGGRVDRYLQPSIGREPGLSGGPLLDVEGRLLGMNTSGLARGSVLTLPSVTLERIVAQLRDGGRIRRGYLGLSSSPVLLGSEWSSRFGQRAGLMVAALEPKGPAQLAGLLLGDVLLALDGARLESVGDLLAVLEGRDGREVLVRVIRAGQEVELRFTLAARA